MTAGAAVLKHDPAPRPVRDPIAGADSGTPWVGVLLTLALVTLAIVGLYASSEPDQPMMEPVELARYA